MDMTLNEISRKLVKNNLKQYGLFFFSVLFSITMTGAYGVLQYSPTVTNVLVDGGSTQTISQAMFFGSMLGIIVFLVYADTLFLKYKSREIGVFLSLGIDRRSVQKIITKEFTVLFQLAALLGLFLSVPLDYLCWSLLNVFLRTQETAFKIGWMGLMVSLVFAIVLRLILRTVNRKYIQTVDILKILKSSDENEKAKEGSTFRLFMGCMFVPTGIVAFFTLQNIGGVLCTFLAFTGLSLAVWGVYLLIIQLVSIGEILKRFRVQAYYKNIVFYNLLKQKIRQYTRSIFVATLLITFTIFGIGFIAAGFIDGYNVALNEPYDYTICTTADKGEMTEERIYRIAEDSNAEITEIVRIDSLLLGVESTYKDGSTDWSSRVVISQSNYNHISGQNIVVPEGSYTLYYDSSMQYKKNAFCGDNSLFYNPTTQDETYFIQNEPVCVDRLFNSRSFFSSFLILNDYDYAAMYNNLGNEYKATSFLLNVADWKNTEVFQENILQAVINDNNGDIFTNWHNSATFDKTESKAEYLPFEGNETRIARVWALFPQSKLSSATTQFEAFATYLMLMLFIAIVAFLSSIMVVGLKLISTIWDDAVVYENLRRLGMKQRSIRGLITKQMVFVYFVPTVIGCVIGSFTTYRIMLVSGVIYIGKTMLVVGGVCGLVVALQSIIFFILRTKILKNYIQ